MRRGVVGVVMGVVRIWVGMPLPGVAEAMGVTAVVDVDAEVMVGVAVVHVEGEDAEEPSRVQRWTV